MLAQMRTKRATQRVIYFMEPDPLNVAIVIAPGRRIDPLDEFVADRFKAVWVDLWSRAKSPVREIVDQAQEAWKRIEAEIEIVDDEDLPQGLAVHARNFRSLRFGFEALFNADQGQRDEMVRAGVGLLLEKVAEVVALGPPPPIGENAKF